MANAAVIPTHKADTLERMRMVLVLRYWHDQTLDQVGNALGITRERVRQIEKAAFMLIRRNPRLRALALDALEDIDRYRAGNNWHDEH